MSLDDLADFFLAFGNLHFLLACVVIGLCCSYRVIFLHGIYLVTLSMMINVALKGSFQIPLSFKPAYAFPSGHMQLATVFYGWMVMHFNHVYFRMFVVMILAGIGSSLIYYHYHTLPDVFAGVFFASLILVSYQTMVSSCRHRFRMFCLPMVSSLVMLYNDAIYVSIPGHAWVAYLVMNSFTLIEYQLTSRHRF